MKLKIARNALNALLEGVVEAGTIDMGGIAVSKKYQYGMAKNQKLIEKEVIKTRKELKKMLDEHEKNAKKLCIKDDKGVPVTIEHPENKETGAKAYKSYDFTAENKVKYEESRDATQEKVNDFLNEDIEIVIHSIDKDDIPAEHMPFGVLSNILDLIDPASDDDAGCENENENLLQIIEPEHKG